MPMMIRRFHFAPPFDETEFRRRLTAEIGRKAEPPRWFGAGAIDVVWDKTDDGGSLKLYSMDPFALAYAAKVALAMGGIVDAGIHGDRPLPPWTATPWIEMPLWSRLKLWVGPTKL